MNESRLEKFIKFISNIQMTIAITALGILVIINLYEIIMRMAINKSMIWIQEISVLFMVWMIFCGFTKIVYDKKDISIDILVEKFPLKFRILIGLLSGIIIIVFLVAFSYYGYFLLMRQIGIGTYIAEIPLTLYTFPVLLNGGTVLLIYINELYKDAKLLINGGEEQWK